MVSEDMRPFVPGAFDIGDFEASPHSPVRLIFGGKPRQDKVRSMKVPKSHFPILPTDPVQKCDAAEEIAFRTDEELGKDFDGCIQLIESELNAVAGLEVDEAVSFQGRAEGPKFTWKQAGGNPAASARATSASMAWRKSAAWLARIENASSTRCRLAACW